MRGGVSPELFPQDVGWRMFDHRRIVGIFDIDFIVDVREGVFDN